MYTSKCQGKNICFYKNVRIGGMGWYLSLYSDNHSKIKLCAETKVGNNVFYIVNLKHFDKKESDDCAENLLLIITFFL